MISEHLRATGCAAMRVPMWVSGRLYKHPRARRLSKVPVKAQLGPGRATYLDDWINVDANIITAKTDAGANLRDELPFHDNIVDVFCSHHVIEELASAADFVDIHQRVPVSETAHPDQIGKQVLSREYENTLKLPTLSSSKHKNPDPSPGCVVLRPSGHRQE